METTEQKTNIRLYQIIENEVTFHLHARSFNISFESGIKCFFP